MAKSRSCLYCEERFELTNHRRLFCSDRCKTRHHREERMTCFYCGDIAVGKDHVFPVMFDPAGRKWEGRDTVQACKECNSILSHVRPDSVEGRVIHLRDRLVSKYKLDQLLPEWDDDELEELGPALRQRIKGKIHERERAKQRVLHMEMTLKLIKRSKA